mgnify:CR=1 FL=1
MCVNVLLLVAGGCGAPGAQLTVQLRSDGTQYDPVVALRQPLVRVSEKIRDDVMELLVIDDEELLESNPKDVSLAYDDQADELALYNTFGLSHPRFFLKLIEFSKEPNALAEVSVATSIAPRRLAILVSVVRPWHTTTTYLSWK